MKNYLEYFLFITFSFIFRILGLKTSRKFAKPLAWFFYNILKIRKKTVIENLSGAFPHLSSKKIEEISFNSYVSMALVLIELLVTPSLSKETLIDQSVCTDIDLLKRKYNEGNGLIILAAHFGNWEWLGLSTALQLEIPFLLIVKEQRNPFVNRWMNNLRRRFGNEIVPMGVAIRKVYQELRNKNIVALAGDQRGPEESIKLPFFGRMTSVYKGPAALSLKTGSPLIYVLAIRQPDFSYRLIPFEVNKDNLPEDYEEKIKVLAERQLRYAEEVISQYPEQWLWMHKRWKH